MNPFYTFTVFESVFQGLLVALARLLRKAIINLIMSVLTEQRDSHWMDFREDSYGEF